MTRKRYTRRMAEGLLVQAVDLLATRTDPSIAQIRQVYTALLQARIPDVNVPDKTVAVLRQAPDDTLRKWHKTVLGGVGAVLMLRGASHPARKRLPPVSFSGVTVQLNSEDLTIEVLAAPFQMLILRIVSLLRMVGPERVARCDCGQVFVRVGKRRTCSVRCQKRVYMRRFRNPPDGECED
jgi:hypothetical protein